MEIGSGSSPATADLLEMLAVLIWIIWGVTREGYYIPEIASQFFVMGFAAGVTAVLFKLNDMTVNGMASAFQSGVADLAGTAVVVGMAKGILSGAGRIRCKCGIHAEYDFVYHWKCACRSAFVHRSAVYVPVPELL